MPNQCYECFLHDSCDLVNPYYIESTRPDDCPLIEIPKHGRLIDADAFFEDICNDINIMTKIGIAVDSDWLWGKLNDALGHAPTIIEAEE